MGPQGRINELVQAPAELPPIRSTFSARPHAVPRARAFVHIEIILNCAGFYACQEDIVAQ